MVRKGISIDAFRDRGTTAVEYALILPALLLLILGAIDAARVMWLQVTLERAVEAATRCAAINKVTCGSAAQTKSYAASQAFGTTISEAAFVSTSAACGTSVTGTVPFTFVIPWITRRQITLSATACYPVQ